MKPVTEETEGLTETYFPKGYHFCALMQLMWFQSSFFGRSDFNNEHVSCFLFQKVECVTCISKLDMVLLVMKIESCTDIGNFLHWDISRTKRAVLTHLILYTKNEEVHHIKLNSKYENNLAISQVFHVGFCHNWNKDTTPWYSHIRDCLRALEPHVLILRYYGKYVCVIPSRTASENYVCGDTSY